MSDARGSAKSFSEIVSLGSGLPSQLRAADQLPALLGLVGLRRLAFSMRQRGAGLNRCSLSEGDLCTLTVDSLTPQIRKGIGQLFWFGLCVSARFCLLLVAFLEGAELVQRLGGRVDEVRRLISGVQKVPSWAMKRSLY